MQENYDKKKIDVGKSGDCEPGETDRPTDRPNEW